MCILCRSLSVYVCMCNLLQSIYVALWLFNIAMGNDPFIDGLPIKNGDFHGYAK